MIAIADFYYRKFQIYGQYMFTNKNLGQGPSSLYNLKMTNYQKLEQRFQQHSRLSELRAISQWDEAVVMPRGAGEGRAQSLAELALILQSMLSGADIGEWLAGCEAESRSLSDWQRANVHEFKRIYIENTAVPVALNQKLLIAKMRCEQQWRELRAQNNWSAFLPSLQEVLNLTRETLQVLSQKMGLSLYDTALQTYSKGLNTQVVDGLFTELKSFLPELTERVVQKQSHEKVILPEGQFPMAAQKSLALELMKMVGFNMEHGRLDESHHPFCGGTPRDVRITTRYREDDFLTSLMGVLHETGHALYEQNLPQEWLEQPVGLACGMAIHESQSLLMEMQVVRSPEFLQLAAPKIRAHLGPYIKNPEALSDENLVRLVTRVKPGLIRTDADEVTYPAHIILRFEIERDLIEDRWSLKELPAVWNEKMQKGLGLTTLGNDKNGCMQDVHWPSGGWGYFPAYTFGAVIAAQLFSKVRELRPSLGNEIATGNFSGLQDWLRQNIWQQGSRVDTLQLVQQASGPLSAKSFRAHLERRYL
jgi:carboxypeptidase Taq